MKITVPDGSGGWADVEGDLRTGSKADANKQAEVVLNQLEAEAHDHMLKVLQFEQTRAREMNLSPEQRAFAMTLLCIAMREAYKDGPEKFDDINRKAWEYFKVNN
jgi:hypothetical protein